MVFPYCCVPGCDNKDGIKHRIPLKNKERTNVWLNNINSAQLFVLKEADKLDNHRVCEKHFEEKYKATSHRLTINAIPTLYLQGLVRRDVPVEEPEDDELLHQPDAEENPEGEVGSCVDHEDDYSYAAPPPLGERFPPGEDAEEAAAPQAQRVKRHYFPVLRAMGQKVEDLSPQSKDLYQELTKMTICAVNGCKSNNRHKNVQTTSFHVFPKNSALRKKWILFCKQDNFNPSTSRICSKHFKKEDFELNFVGELLNIKRRPTLVEGAVPTIYMEMKTSKRAQRTQVRERRELVNQLLTNPDCSTNKSVDYKLKYEELLEEHKKQQTELSIVTNECKQKDLKIIELEQELSEIVQKLELQIHSTQERDELLGKVLTKAQRNKLENKRAWVKWSSEDMSKAFTLLRYLNLRAYKYLRNNLNYPLPHLTTLQRWAKKKSG